MRHKLLERYERDDQGNIVIDVSAPRLEDLYNDFDKSAPYIRRDLDQDLAEYLTDCTRELGRTPFIIRFNLGSSPDEAKLTRVRHSVHSYFQYLGNVEKHQILLKLRRSSIFFFIGLGILFMSVSINHFIDAAQSVTINVAAEGLTVAAWVALWESLAMFLIGWFPHRKKILIYRRIADAQLVFRTPDGDQVTSSSNGGATTTSDSPNGNSQDSK